ncbi:MAG: ATP-binding protein, partial [Muribaculaceae bacterium]
DLPRGFSIPAGSLQARRPLSIPEDALREAIVNALVHQSLRVHRPIQIIRYSNRIEIINPGFSLKPAETLGEPGSEMRNPTIGSIFHETKLAEAKGTGISTMRRLMKEAGMMPPTFDSDLGRNTFTTRILLHHFMPEEDVRWLASNRLLAELNDAQKTAIIFLREVGAIDNITYRQLSGVSAREASASLKRLETLGLLKMNGQGRNTYYTPSVELNEMYAANGATSISNNATSAPNNATPVSNNATSVPKDATSILATLPKEISLKINSLGKRVPLSTLEALTIELCTIRPFSIEELALLLQRTVSHIRNKVLPPLLSDGSVRFTIPEMRNHPNQKYTAVNHE